MSNHLILLILPLVITNVLHMIIVKFELLKFLSIPINKKAFGENKTYRGILFITFFNTLTYCLIKYSLINHIDPKFDLIIGGLLGLAYALAELPNSYIKRRLNIAPGERAKKNKMLFLFLDKSDSALIASITYSLLFSLSFYAFIILFLSSSLTHIAISGLLVIIRIKKSF